MPPIPRKKSPSLPGRSLLGRQVVASAPAPRFSPPVPRRPGVPPAAPPTPEEADGWKPRGLWVPSKRFIKVYMDGSLVDAEAEGVQLGNLLAHPSLNFDEQDPLMWVVTILQTYLRVVKVKSKGAAMRVAEVLWFRCGAAVQQPSKLKILERMPKWVEGWAMACREASDYVDPAPFVSGAFTPKEVTP